MSMDEGKVGGKKAIIQIYSRDKTIRGNKMRLRISLVECQKK